MQGVTHCNLEPTPIHPMISFVVPDNVFDRLPTPHPSLLLSREFLLFAAMQDLHGAPLGFYAAVDHVHHSHGGLDADLRQQRGAFLDLGG